jgi:hypothetical protein
MTLEPLTKVAGGLGLVRKLQSPHTSVPSSWSLPGTSVASRGADHLAAYARLVPAAHDSGKKTGNDKRMRGGNKSLKYLFYQSAFASLRSCPESRAFYDRKRAEGKRHIQALIALARQRVNVLWAMLRDGTTFETRSMA